MKTIAFLLLAALGIAVFAGCTKTPDTQTDDIDGGVRHYEDTGAPKTIESTEIISFSCKFSTMAIMQEDSILAGRIFTLTATKDGCSYNARTREKDIEDRQFVPAAEFFGRLQQIVSKYDMAQHNGVFYKVSGLPPDLGMEIDVQYASGERIQASDNQDCFLSVEAMEELVALFRDA